MVETQNSYGDHHFLCYHNLVEKSVAKTLMILPAAGWGKRVGSPEAKEMLLGPKGQPLIDFSLHMAFDWGWPVHVVTRPQKSILREHLDVWKRRGLDLSVQLVDPTHEWEDTVMASKAYWHESNLLVLPDAEFEPKSAILELATKAMDCDWAATVFDEKSMAHWGSIAESDGKFAIGEKVAQEGANVAAWGHLFFRGVYGEELFDSVRRSRRSGQTNPLSAKGLTMPLDWYRDLTRVDDKPL